MRQVFTKPFQTTQLLSRTKLQDEESIFKNRRMEPKMLNAPGSTTTQTDTSNIDPAIVMNEPDRVLRNPGNLFFLTSFNRQGQKVQEPVETLDDAFWSKDKSPLSILARSKAPAPEPLSKFLNHPKLRAKIKEIAQGDARRLHVLEIYKFLLKAAEDTVLGTIQIRVESAND